MNYDNTNRGVLFKVDEKRSDKGPDYSGSLNVGGEEYFLDAWIKTAQSGRKFMSVSVKLKEKQPTSGKTHGQMRDERRRNTQEDDGPPF